MRGWARQRAALLADGNELVEPGAREQVVAVGATGDPVTAVSSVKVRPEAFADFRAVLRDIEDALLGTAGFIRLELLEPVKGVQDDTIVFMTFDDRSHLDRWLASDQRRDLLARLVPFTEGERILNVVGGYAGWFSGDARVPRWKSAVAVLIALIPTALLYSWARAELFPDIPLVLGVVLGNVFGIIVLTWLLMPWITKRLDRWLRR